MFCLVLGEQWPSEFRSIQYGTVSQQVKQAWSHVDSERDFAGVVIKSGQKLLREMDDQRNAQDLRMHSKGVPSMTDFLQRLAMVGSDHDHAVVI